ncbi:hypothetical protein [Gracilibacillus dipsosauri]|uniref:Uncharacterized protein n=1 Tax=Gracilibacillus dipsosauri TaxID=178340 RepID=A0A317L252_9BACI|nr:hypothetical protein [Gracilibacillus dipsosauri]PWU69877.1 hypothetical protein DLJ74_02800 [Gracilibacillus dipsosauri]
MQTDSMRIGERILFILGMSLCGVLFFVLVVGVMVALLISWMNEEEEEIVKTIEPPSENPKRIVRKR